MGIIEDYLNAGYNWAVTNLVNILLSLYTIIFNIVYSIIGGFLNFFFDILSFMLDIAIFIFKIVVEPIIYFSILFVQSGSIFLKIFPDIVTLLFFAITHIYLILVIAETIILGIVIITPGFMEKLSVFWRLNFGMGQSEDDITYSLVAFFLRLPKYLDIIYKDVLLLINTIIRLLNYLLAVLSVLKDTVLKIIDWAIKMVKIFI